jgi:hypothetical protein
VEVRAEDRTWQFQACLERELAAAEQGGCEPWRADSAGWG